MQLSNYQKLTSRTNTDLGSKAINATHCVLGIVGELNEAWKESINYRNGWGNATKESVTDEFNDISWYVSELANLFNINLETGTYKLNNISDSIGWLAENTKKYLAYDKEINVETLQYHLNNIISFVKHEVENIIGGYTFEEGLQRNINKLQKRFPTSFNKEDALNKQDESFNA